MFRTAALLMLLAMTGAAGAGPPIGVDPNGLSYYGVQRVFKDVFTQSMPWRSNPKDRPLELDERGWVQRLSEDQTAWTLTYADREGQYPGGRYVLRYTGQGTLEPGGAAELVTAEPGRLILELTPEAGPIRLELTSTDPQDPLREIELFEQRFEGTIDEFPFDPRFLELVAPFDLIRVEALMRAGSGAHTSWSTRVTPAHATQASKRGMAIEHAIDLANRLEQDLWFVVPHHYPDDSIAAMAAFAAARLDPGRKAYVEWGHDVGVWPTAASQYAIEQGRAHQLSDDWSQARTRFYVERSLATFDVWEAAFADRPDDLVCVLAKVGNDDEVLTYREAAKRADAFGLVAIFGQDFGKPANADATLAMEMDAFMDALAADAARGPSPTDRKLIAAAQRHGLDVVSFYFTPMIFAVPSIEQSNPEQFKKLVARTEAAHFHPRMASIYTTFIDAWYEAGGGLWINHGLVHHPTKWGTYGLMRSMNDDPTDVEEAPKFVAVLEAIEQAKGEAEGPGAAAMANKVSDLKPRVRNFERANDPVFGRVTAHHGARIDWQGFFDDAPNVKFDTPWPWPRASIFVKTPLFVRGTDREGYWSVFFSATGETWDEPQTVTVVPEDSGQLRIILRAITARRNDAAGFKVENVGRVRVEFDDLRVDGAELRNSSFEQVNEEGAPLGWRLTGEAQLVTGAAEAAEGRCFVRVSDASHAIATLDGVEAGVPVKLTYRARELNADERYDLRIGFNGAPRSDEAAPAEAVELDMKDQRTTIPDEAVLWKTDFVVPDEKGVLQSNKSNARRILLTRVGPAWSSQAVTIVPTAEGAIELTLHATRRIDPETGRLVRHWVDYADLRVEGATLAAGDFQNLAPDEPNGNGAAWRRIGRDPGAVLHEDDGERFVRVWYERGLRTTLRDVEAGQPITVRYRVRLP
jgi:hypothetical protein